MEVCRRFGSGGAVAAPGGARGVPVTQASGRTAVGPWGQPERGLSRCSGHPDEINVWHAVSRDKALRANNFSQMRKGAHG
ncbi:hypothetical protein GCM10010282_15860 [Streptomyces roseolus]|nr:hypothetical protein GCM10010282_15860 [Streptomyces roseolus]